MDVLAAIMTGVVLMLVVAGVSHYFEKRAEKHALQAQSDRQRARS